MKFLRILILFLALSPTVFANGANDFFVGETAVRHGFPNVFRPIGNVFRKIFGKKRREIIEYVPDVINLTLSRNEVTAGCATNRNVCAGSKGIGIYTEVSNPANDVITYVYKISGGKISGEGDKVVWDLAGVAPGTYTITAGVDNSCGVCGRTMTKTVTVVECADCK